MYEELDPLWFRSAMCINGIPNCNATVQSIEEELGLLKKAASWDAQLVILLRIKSQ